MRQQEHDIIRVGLKFKSQYFAADAEIVAIRDHNNEVDVKLISSEGHAHIERWDLQYTKSRFDCGEYIPVDLKKKINISII